MNPDQLSAFVKDTITDAVCGALFAEHGLRVLDMELTVWFIDALLQKPDKIIDKIAVKIEGIPQIIGNVINVALHIAAI